MVPTKPDEQEKVPGKPVSNAGQENGEGKTDKKSHAPKDKDRARGDLLMWIFSILLGVVTAAYLYGHAVRPNGLFAPTQVALDTVSEAKTALAGFSADVLSAPDVANLTQVSYRLRLLGPQFGAPAGFAETLDQLDTQLAGKEVNRVNLAPLFTRLTNIIQIGPSSFFWHGSRDRWVEMAFWVFVGALVFLLSEIKRFYILSHGTGKRDFTLYTPWYVVSFFRGPFIGLITLLALTSISFNAIGITVNMQSAPMEVLVLMAAILGLYGREANKQLDIIAKTLLPDAWKAAHPSDKVLTIEPHDQPIIVKAKETHVFTVEPKLPVHWLLEGPAEKGKVEDGKYTAPESIAAPVSVILLALAEDEEYNVARVKLELRPTPPAGGDGSNGGSGGAAGGAPAESKQPAPEGEITG